MCNVWYAVATSYIELQYTRIRGIDNRVANRVARLSRWQGSADQWQLLDVHVAQQVWLQVSHELLELDTKL